MSTLGDADVVKTYMEIIARSCAGEYMDKQWVIMFGERNCGKGVLQAINKLAFGPYVNTINPNDFLLRTFSNGDAAKALGWAVNCQYTRQTYTNEVTCDATNRHIKLDGNMIKGFLSGGDVLYARRLHENGRQFQVAAKLMMNLNDIPVITPVDAVSNMMLIKFPYKFVSADDMTGENVQPFFRRTDQTLKSHFITRNDVVDAFTWMVIDAYKDTPVVPCAKVKEDSLDYQEDVGDDLLTMTRNFKITNDRNDFVLTSELKEFLRHKRHNISISVAKERLKKMGGKYDKNCRVGGRATGRGFVYVRCVYDNDEEPTLLQAPTEDDELEPRRA